MTAELLVKVLPLTVAVPKLPTPPPLVAELPVKVLPLTLAFPSFVEAAAEWDADGGVAGEGAAAHTRRTAGVVVEAAADSSA